MAQFGGNKNPPWAQQGGRQGPPGGGPGAQPGGGIDVPGLVGAFGAAANAGQAGPPVFHQGGGGLPPGLGVGHLGVPGGHGPAVTLAAMAGQPGVYPRAMGPGGFPGGPLIPQQQPQPQVLQLQQGPPPQQQQQPPPQLQQQQGQQGQQGQQQQQQQAASQRVFTGTVTKLHDNFGFVDEDVFFQTSVVKGQTPRVNDRVLVEAAYNANMPFKWNATRIQVLPNQNPGRGPNSGPGGQGQPLPTPTPSVTTTSTLNAHAFANTAQPPPVQMSHPPPPRNTQPRNEAAFGGGPPNNPGPGNQNPPGRGDHRNDRGGGGPGGMNRNNTNAPSPPVRGGADSNRGSNRGPGMPTGGRDHGGSRRGDDRNSNRDRSGGNDRADNSHTALPKDYHLSQHTGNIRDRSRDKERSMSSRSSPPPMMPTRKRSRSPPRRTRSRSRSRSPPRRRARTAPRYNVSVPKVSLNFPESGVFDLKKRYNNMYVPSDFFMADHSWMKSFPVHDGFKIQYASTFHVFNKDQVESPLLSDAVFDPTDADHSFSAKVMLMAMPPPDALIEKTCQLAESSATNRDNLVHPTRAIQFLVGARGKNETIAIGGPWSPSLDGPNPESDPSVLVKTAIRVTRALTGIDLTNCTQWHRFLEIHYRRQESSSKPARTETTVIFLPDIWSVMPTSNEHVEAKTLYEKALDAKINPPQPKPEPEEVSPEVKEESKETVAEPVAEEATDKSETVKTETTDDIKVEPVKDEKPEVKEDVADQDEEAEDQEPEADEAEDKEVPTSGDDLDVKSMKVNELKEELAARGLNAKGLKAALVERLQEAIENETTDKGDTEAMDTEQTNTPVEDAPKEETETPENGKKTEEEVKKEVKEESADVVMEDDKKPAATANPAPKSPVKKTEKASEAPKDKPVVKELDEKQKNALKTAYKFPSEPSILVHPHPKAKSGKFDCTVMSLSVLLDYRTEDNKENTFEVSLFAELFNEMLMRDSGFRLYKSVLQAADSKSSTATTSDTDKHSKSSSNEPSEDKADKDKKDESGSSTEESKKSEKVKIVTKDRDLLLACSYFDLGHCGYFETKDLEDILTTINLNLSRAQIKKLVKEVTSGKDQQVNYRQFTDKPEDPKLAETEVTSKIQLETEEVDLSKEETLGQGFKAFVPKPKRDQESSVNSSSIAADGICSYRGSVVDVGKLLTQLKRSETARSDTESQLKSACKSVQELKDASEKHASVKDKLQTEVKDLKKQLKRVEDDMKRSQTDSSKYYTILKDIHSKVHPAVNAPTSPSPNKDHVKPSSDSEQTVATVNGKSEPSD